MTLYEWAHRWGIPAAAINELVSHTTSIKTNKDPVDARAGSETANQQLITLDAARHGARLWRNNVGATTDENGNFFRFGLCNETKEINAVIKSSDLIGIEPILIKPEHVGRVFGLFIAREMKELGWQYTATDHEVCQKRFIDLVNSLGGDARFDNTGRYK